MPQALELYSKQHCKMLNICLCTVQYSLTPNCSIHSLAVLFNLSVSDYFCLFLMNRTHPGPLMNRLKRVCWKMCTNSTVQYDNNTNKIWKGKELWQILYPRCAVARQYIAGTCSLDNILWELAPLTIHAWNTNQ